MDKAELEQNEEVVPFKYNISSYGADYTVDSLVRRMRDGSIFVPNFQRHFVWSIAQSSRFIESLLLGLPVPGIFFSREDETNKLLVIDGQQRLSTLLFFYNGKFPDSDKPFILKGVQPEFEEKTYKTLRDDEKRKLDDSIIHATIIKQDIPSDDDSSIYFVFERLNTGGMALTSQEIRSSIYRGKFNNLINELNMNEDWRTLYGNRHARLKDAEAILRFFAFYYEWKSYKKTIKEFLNTFMAKNKDLAIYDEKKLKSLFTLTVSVINKSVGKRAFRLKNQPTIALIDAIMVGVAHRLQSKSISTNSDLIKQFNMLTKDENFIDSITTSTSDEVNVKNRMRKSIDAFSSVK